MKPLLSFLCLLAWSSSAYAQDRVLGLLSLPEVFGGDGPCEQFKPGEILLYAAPDGSETVGSIRGDGGCEGRNVRVHGRDGRVSEFPTEEYQYEAPAAIALQRHGRWFELRLADGTAWVLASERDEFFPLEDLVHDNITTERTDAWDGTLADTPGGTLVRLPSHPNRQLVGYLEPLENEIEIPVAPGQDPEEIRKRYPGVGMGSVRSRDGRIRLLYFHEGIRVEAFARPDRQALVVARVPNNQAVALRGLHSSPPPVFVFARRPGWFQVALRNEASNDWRTERRAWIEETKAWRFTAVTDETERERLANESWGREYDHVRVVDHRRVGDALWFQVEFLTHSECESGAAPTVVGRGWMPAHSRSGEATIWFAARGC